MADTETTPVQSEEVEQKQEESSQPPADDTGRRTPGEPAEAGDAPASGDDAAEEDTYRSGPTGYEHPSSRRNRDESPMYEGTVSWFSTERGYGFIKVESEELGNPDAHVHGDNVEEDAEGNPQVLVEGQKVKFRLRRNPPRKDKPEEGERFTAKDVIPGEKPKREPKVIVWYKGTCVFFNKEKKFGFIHVNDCDKYPTGVDVWFHSDSIRNEKGKKGGLVADQECEFQLKEDRNGKDKAVDVKPGKAPPEDPDKDKSFHGHCVKWLADKQIGFLRIEGKEGEGRSDVMVHMSKILGGADSLKERQKVTFKIVNRRDRNDPKKPPRPAAVDVVPGDVPKETVLTGVVKFFNEADGYGFVSAKGKNQDYFCHQDQIIGNDKVLVEKQIVTFVPQQGLKKGKDRATKVRPGPKPVDGEVAELTPEETPFEPYLPAHVEPSAQKKVATKKMKNLPKHIQIERDDTLSNEEKEAALKKHRNYLKKQRNKRAKNREAESPSDEEKVEEVIAPVVTLAEEPVERSQPVKKQKSKPKPAPAQPKQQQQQAPKETKASSPPQPQQPQTNSKKKKAPKKQEQQQEPAEEPNQKQQQQPKQQPPQQPPAGNKKKPKRNKGGKKDSAQRRAAAKQARQSQQEEDVIDAYFNANKKARQSQANNDESLFTWFYNFVLSFCKSTPAKRKLKH